MIAGVLAKIVPMTVFLNPNEDSYKRLGKMKAPRFVSWSRENRSQLVRIPAAQKEYRRAELRSPDPAANPYIAFALLIRAALYGIKNGLALPAPVDSNLYQTDGKTTALLSRLPDTLAAAKAAANADEWIRECLPKEILEIYCKE